MKTPILGCGHFRAFRPGFSLWHTCHVVRHGHFTLKQLRLPVLNEMHTNSCTGPRLNGLVTSFTKVHYLASFVRNLALNNMQISYL